MSNHTDEVLIEHQIRFYEPLDDPNAPPEDNTQALRDLREMVQVELNLRIDFGGAWKRTDLNFEDFLYSSSMCAIRQEMLMTGDYRHQNATELQAIAWVHA